MRRPVIFVILAVLLIQIIEVCFFIKWTGDRMKTTFLEYYKNERLLQIKNVGRGIKEEFDSVISKISISTNDPMIISGNEETCSEKLIGILPLFYVHLGRNLLVST